MRTEDEVNGKDLSIASRVVVAATHREASENVWARKFWIATMAVSGLGGIASGIVGLVLSFLVAEGVIDPSRGVRLAVPTLIVASLSLLMLSAHAMDRLHSIKVNN